MDFISRNFPDSFNTDNVLFHYTSIEKGFIITGTQVLKMFSRKNSNDPLENSKIQISNRGVSHSDIDGELIEKSTDEKTKELTDSIKLKVEKSKQVCFCLNKIECFNTEYGYLKPRMWDQYGGRYNGVCLVFDKNKFIEENKDKIDFSSHVSYVDFKKLKGQVFEINRNSLLKDEEGYINDLLEKINQKISSKHFDYSGENEFRLLSNSDSDTVDLRFSESILGLIFSTTDFMKYYNEIEYFNNYSISKKIEFRVLSWKSNTFDVLKYNGEIPKIKLQ